jgi:hypothetical protein
MPTYLNKTEDAMAKFLLMISMITVSLNGFASPSRIRFEQIKKTERPREFWVKNVHLEVDGEFYRLNDSEINKRRICRELGFKKAGGSRVEFGAEEYVVSVGPNLKVIRELGPDEDYILNVNCFR